MSRGESPAVAACVEAVEGLFGGLGRRLSASAESAARAFDETPVVTSERVMEIARPLAEELLADDDLIGAGLVMTPGRVADELHLLAWWQGEDRRPIVWPTPLERSADYSRQEWFRTPMQTGSAHVTGPYIDYVCTDEFVLTTTVPVRGASAGLIGVMGADVLAETLERLLSDVFRKAGATLVNHHDRAVLSGDPRTFAGDPIDRSEFPVVVPCTGFPLTVLARQPD
ncbi:cache domain-containing protein [Promicromonospora sp. Populi]|uniref:cache domain-containing protein n=1 Tax=Promicromonospora sp. Populi TaxID=3239420 RepID=UPI0034E1B907